MKNNFLFFSDATVDVDMAKASPCAASSHAMWRTCSDHVTRNALAARNNEALRTSQRQTVVLYSPWLSLKKLDAGIFVIGRIHTRARNWLSVCDWPLHSRPLPPQTPLLRFFFWREAPLYIGSLKWIIHLQTVRQNWWIKSGELFRSKLKLLLPIWLESSNG